MVTAALPNPKKNMPSADRYTLTSRVRQPDARLSSAVVNVVRRVNISVRQCKHPALVGSRDVNTEMIGFCRMDLGFEIGVERKNIMGPTLYSDQVEQNQEMHVPELEVMHARRGWKWKVLWVVISWAIFVGCSEVVYHLKHLFHGQL